MRRGARVAVGDQQVRADRQGTDRGGQPGHQSGAQPVAPVPDPGARGHQDHQQPALTQQVAQRHRRPVGRGDRHVRHRTARFRGRRHLAHGDGRGVGRLSAQRAPAQVAVGEEGLGGTRGPGEVGAQAAPGPQGRHRLVGRAQPGGHRGAPFVLVAVEQGLGGTLVPGQGELPRQVLGVPEPLLDPLGAEGAQQVRGVTGEEGPSVAPAPGQPVVQGVHAGVEQVVRGSRAAAPLREGVADQGDQRVGGHQIAAGREQPVQPPDPVRQRPRGDLVRCAAVQQGLAGPRQFGAQRGDGVALDGGTAREADAEQLAHGGAGSVAADHVTPAPPGGLGAQGVCGDAPVVLFQGVQPAVEDQLDQGVRGGGVAQSARQRVLGDVQGGRVVLEGEPVGVPAAPHGAPGGEVRALVAQRRTAQAVRHGRRVRVQDDRTGRPGLVLARPLVEHDGGHARAREGEGQGQADGARADDDHRVHGAAPDVRYVITERMQPIGGVCVK